MTRYVIHDYETFGKDTRKDRASQFAAVVTDEEFNIIEKHEFFCKPMLDNLPSPEACYVTGVTPLDIIRYQKDPEKTVLSEYEFFHRINDIFSVDKSCVFGYNNVRFDDEMSRHGFYRNAIAPYDREFKNGCSRMDMITMVRMFAFLYPDEINTKNEAGEVSFKLSDLATANNFKMEHAHDAFSDVETTLELAKFMRNKHPDFWNFWANRNNKKEVQKVLDNHLKTTPFLPILAHSTYFGKNNQYFKPVVCLGRQSSNPKDPDHANYICIEIENVEQLEKLFSLPVEKVKSLLFAKKEEREQEGVDFPIPVHTIKTNQLPVFITPDMMNVDNMPFKFDVPAVKSFIKESKPEFKEVCEYIRNNYSNIKSYVLEVVNNKKEFDPCIDSDLGLYSSEIDLFKDDNVKQWMAHLNYNISMKKMIGYFNGEFYNHEPLLEQFAKRLILRNFMSELKEECRAANNGSLWKSIIDNWKQECADKIRNGYVTTQKRPLFMQNVLSINEEQFLNTLKEYAESDDTLKQKIAKDLTEYHAKLVSFFPQNKPEENAVRKINP